jgi:hypothetical protein
MGLVYDKFPEIVKNWLLLFYPNPKGSQQKPFFYEVPFRGFRGKKGKFVVPVWYFTYFIIHLALIKPFASNRV